MNERIRELAEQANITIRTYYDESGSTLLELEKFAVLIVKECCQKLENDGMVEVAMEIKEHFGIEE